MILEQRFGIRMKTKCLMLGMSSSCQESIEVLLEDHGDDGGYRVFVKGIRRSTDVPFFF